jgi:glycerate 2-kinase
MQASRLMTQSMQGTDWGDKAARILASALQAVDPARAVAAFMHRLGNQLRIGQRTYDLNRIQRIYLIGAGKAGAPMAQAAARLLGERLTRGLVVVKEGYGEENSSAEALASDKNLEILEASHPLPDERGLKATRRILALAQAAREDDLVVCLISGGGSALLTLPVEGVGLRDLQALTTALLSSGAAINEINTLRKHLDQVKGGQLAQAASPARLAALILSDVVGDPLDVIASGPTVADSSTFKEAHKTLERYGLLGQTPKAIQERLQRGLQGEIPENPKPGDPLFERVQNLVVGSNLEAARAARQQAQAEGFNTLLLTTDLQGEARQAGKFLAAIAQSLHAHGEPLQRPSCLIVGGETTVTVQGDGLGGRNLELALGAVEGMTGLPEVALITLATDGGDGPTQAAGALVTGETLERARQMGLQPGDYLARNDSYHFFEPLGDLLKPGPTRTNVNDLAFLFAF